MKRVENTKLIISIGSLQSDYNSGMFTYHLPTAATIEVLSLLFRIVYAQTPHETALGPHQDRFRNVSRHQDETSRAQIIRSTEGTERPFR